MVSEVGFMMEDEKLQLIIGLFGELKKVQEELKTEINDVKADINDVKKEIKNDMENSISAVKDEVSAVKNELRHEINDFQERIRAGQDEFEERVTRTVKTRLEDVSSMVEQETRNLREDLSKNIEATRQDVEATRRDLEATQRDLETQLAALQVKTRRAGGSSAGTNADKVKPPKFDGSTSWIVFQRQFGAAAIHNDWTPGEKSAHLLSVLQGQAAHILHSIPAEASYEDIVGALRNRFGDHQLAAAYRSHLKARVQTGGETLQEFAAAAEELAHQAFVGLPVDHIQTEAAHAFIDGVRDWEVKQNLLLGGACTLNEALNQALRIEAARATAWPTARLREVTRAPTGRLPTPPERRRSGRPVCWWCGEPSHSQKYCRQRPPEEMGQDPRTRRGVSQPSITPPRFIIKVLAEWANGSLTGDGYIQERPSRVTIDTGASVTVAKQTSSRGCLKGS
jgi:hypothetical protein